MEFETYADVIDSYNLDNQGYSTLTDYIKGNNIKIKEIEMDPIGDLEKILREGKAPMEKEGIMQASAKRIDPKVTMEEVAKNHDDWWDRLTEEEKQKIADEAQAATTYFNEERANNALEQYRKDYDSFKSNTE